MSSTASTLAFQMWDQLIAVITAEIPAGKRMAGLKDVRQSAQFAADVVPAAAVQLLSFTPADYGTRRHEVTVEFLIVIAASSTGTDSRVANLDDAMSSLRSYVDDGNGNGLVAILNDPANFGLGGIASRSKIGAGDFKWDVNDGPQQTVWAYFEQHYSAVGYVSF